MPRCCSIRGCKSNYASSKEKVSTFSLPKSDPARSLWLQAIPSDLSHIQNPIVCIKHFEDQAIVRIDKCVEKGKLVEYPRVYPKLALGAIPCIFPGFSKKDTLLSLPGENLWNSSEQYNMDLKESKDKHCIDPLTDRSIASLADINKYFSDDRLGLGREWVLVECAERTVLCFMSVIDVPFVRGSISVGTNLTFQLCLNHEKVTSPSDFLTIISVDQLRTLMEFIEGGNDPSDDKTVSSATLQKKISKDRRKATKIKRAERKRTGTPCLGSHTRKNESVDSKGNIETSIEAGNNASDSDNYSHSSSPLMFTVKKEEEESLLSESTDLRLEDNSLIEDIKPSISKTRKHERRKTSYNRNSVSNLIPDDLLKKEKNENGDSNVNFDPVFSKEKKIFVCDQCTFTTDRKSTLNRHKFYHTGEKPFACNECSYKCSRKSTLKTHMLIHTGEKQFACDLCSYTCSANGYLKRHKLTHTGEKSLACDQCGFVCNRLYNLKIHKRQHTGEKPFACDKCSFTCSQSSNLKNHKLKHMDEKPFSCDKCNFTCHYLYHLKMHELKHTGEKPYLCDQCSYSCRQKGNFDRHLLKHTGEKPYACDQCNFKCSDKGNLKRHRFKHTGEKPFSCDQCSFTCSEKSYLNRHKYRHADKKPFSCNQCSFQCSRSNVLKHHKYTHTGEKPFACDQCNFMCTIMNVLKRHKLMNHTL